MKIFYRFILCLVPFLSSFRGAPSTNEDQQILRINFLAGEPKYIHPHLIRDTEATTLTKLLYEGLTRVNLKGEVELALARKIEVSKCGTKYTIYLRPSKWSNGEEVTSYHFVNAWKSAISPDTKCSNPYRFFIIKNVEKVFKNKTSMEKVGIYAPAKDRIEIHLEHAALYFKELLADPIYSPLYDYTKTIASVFNGPFLPENMQGGNHIYLKKNPLYWDAAKVKLNGIKISHITDPMTVYDLFKQKKLDYVGSPFSDLPEEILQKANDVKSTLACAVYWMSMNLESPKFASKNIRKALSLSVDRDYIAKYILSNASPSLSVLPKELPLIKSSQTKKTKTQLKNLLLKGLAEINIPFDDFSITLSYTTTPRHANVAKYLKYQWEKVLGIKVKLDKSDWNTFYSKLSSNNLEMGGSAKYVTCFDPLFFLEPFYDKKMNRSQWENSDFKKLIDLANQCIDKKEQVKYLAKAEEILTNDYVLIPLYTHKHLYLCNPRLKNLCPSRLLYQDFKWAYFE